ncbi:MAG: hypothetical protein MJ138_03505 [Kiritimatiellae bacterium]|nr:hypothetical protein [Kiritimatiellia bacterium]
MVAFAAAFLCACGATAAQTVELGRGDVRVTVVSQPDRVDVARDFFVTLTISAPGEKKPALPDLRDRFRGFSVSEDFPEPPLTDSDGTTTLVSRWRLVPEPCAKKYGIKPFVVGDFYTAPVRFEGPAAREVVTGGMEIDPKKDLPPLSWRLAGQIAAALCALALLAGAAVWATRKIREAVRVHKMSPLQRAYYELDKLLKKGLPGRGFYKDFYVELTMVVRRYVERKYGVKAPNMTTEEFLRATGDGASALGNREALRKFLESADLVKFAGVEATPEMADGATDSARGYLKADAVDAPRGGAE